MFWLNDEIQMHVHLQLIMNAGRCGSSRKQINEIVDVDC